MKKIQSLFSILAYIGIFVFATVAQTPTGAIEGNVTDPQSAIVSGATVTITETSTGRKITTTSNSEGFFTARSLQPGIYSVKIEKQGFSTATAETVTVQVGQVGRADIQLKVGSASETVNVNVGETEAQVDTSRQTVDGVITSRQITALPLNSRNFLDLAVLQPGVTVVDGGNIDPTKVNAYRAVRVNGGSGTGTRVQLEGIDVTDETVGTTVANFSTDAVQEFNLSRSSFDLSTSLTTSGAISIASRTGSNKFSGSGFYFKQDDRFDARPGFEATKPEFNRDQTGYRFGGPIWKNKLFFFSNFERFNQQNFASFTSGDFPQFNGSSTLPIITRNALNRIDWVANNSVKIFYLHNYSDDKSTGGSLRSPFDNVDWTNTHVVGANILGSRFTHSFRFGLVNFNNRIQSQELSGFGFTRTSQGIPVQINVGDISVGPNGLAPQETYQDNYQFKYDGGAVFGNHVIRYGGEANKIILGGFANFAGPLTVNGDFTSSTSSNPLDYLLDTFGTGPSAGFFTAAPAHNLPFGGKRNTRYAAYVGDQWKISRNISLNLGVRYNFDTNFFSSPDVPKLPQLEQFGTGLGNAAKYPKNAFSPQAGFAWDVFGDAKTSVRGGFYIAYESNIFNNSLFDEFARITTGIGPTALSGDFVVGPTGAPINVTGIPGCAAADTAAGDYTCLTGRPISTVLTFVGQIHTAVQAAYSNLGNYSPTAGPSEFANTNGVTFGGQFPGGYKLPYSLQGNIGVQRELFKGHVLSVDYVWQRGVGLPLILEDFERRRDSRFFNATAAQTKIASVIKNATVNPTTIQAYLDTHPTASIATFGLANDTIWPGRSSLTRARLVVGGLSLYQGLQVSMNGRFSKILDVGGQSLLKGMTYTVGYAWATSKSTNGSGRPEFIANAQNNRRFNDAYGASGLDRRHNLTVSASLDIIGGFRIDQIYRFSTSPPLTLFIPNNRSSSGLFTSDLNGDGGTGSGSPRGDILPETNIGDFGRKYKNIKEINAAIGFYNTLYAGKITPAGQRLIDAGFFTAAQLQAIEARTPTIPLIPENNPNPFENRFNADYRLSRPVRIWKENWILEPSISFFNVFNNSPRGVYTGLSIPNVSSATGRTGTTVTNFGALNYNYATADDLARLDNEVRGLIFNRRQMQFGIRFSF